MRILGSFLLLVLIAFPAVILQNGNGLARAAEPVEDEVMEEADVADEDADMADEGETTEDMDRAADAEEDEEEETGLKKSADADTALLFVKPQGISADLPAGSIVHVVVGFQNNGKEDFLVDSMDASFRYPQDFSYFIQNFTALKYNKVVEPSRQASFEYSFIPSENFNGRPFGLVLSLYYQDKEGKMYMDSVFNETVNIVDPVEGFDTETMFLYLTLAALAILVIVALQQTVFSSASKRLTSSKPKVEMGTQKNGDIDYDWIPKENLALSSKRASPRRRRGDSGTASSGSADER